MSEQESRPTAEERCPRCDSILPQGAERCLMCGLPRPPTERPAAVPADELSSVDKAAGTAAGLVSVEPPVDAGAAGTAAGHAPTVLEFPVRESHSHRLFWLVASLVVIGLAATWLALRDEGPRVMAAFIPTTTPLPPTVTNTPTWTPLPSQTLPPSPSPSPSGTPAPTSTPREPRFHAVAAGETLFGLSLLYRVSAESIAAANEFDLNSPIQSGQSLVIPWPTATPPLESVLLEINGEPVMADAANCEIITIQDGDSAYALSAIRGVPLEAIIAVNRQTMDSIALLQPGDTLCIPRILYGDTIPPTAGPSPTPSLTPPPGGPSLLYPADGASFAAGDGPIVLQWVAVKDLAEDEWYMVEVRDADDRDALPHRGFTRDQSLRLPDEWQPGGEGPQPMAWRVSIVAVTGRRSDGGFIYTFRGTTGAPSHFLWEGAE